MNVVAYVKAGGWIDSIYLYDNARGATGRPASMTQLYTLMPKIAASH
jgi:hypothetical protein